MHVVKHMCSLCGGTHFILILMVCHQFASSDWLASILSHVTVRVPLLKAIILRMRSIDVNNQNGGKIQEDGFLSQLICKISGFNVSHHLHCITYVSATVSFAHLHVWAISFAKLTDSYEHRR